MPEKDMDTSYIDACIKHGVGTITGNYKMANKAANKIYEIVTELKKKNNLECLFNFIEHKNESVRLWSSSYLLDLDKEERAIITLKNLSRESKSLVSFSAKVILEEWKNGTLKMYFKE
jgi:predicted KAP-like P-loop ATPase